MNKQQLIDKGFDVSHWPTRYSRESDGSETIFGDMVGMVYDTSKWPVPDDTYHPDNWPHWHFEDPNRPPASQDEKDAFEKEVMDRAGPAGAKFAKRRLDNARRWD